jgi:hypothetical protein
MLLTLPESIAADHAGQRLCRTMAFFRPAKPMNLKKIMVMLIWLRVSRKPSKKWLFNNQEKAKIFPSKLESSKKRAKSRLQRKNKMRAKMLLTKRESPV